jgi:histidine phosphotransferase ChpT
VQDRLLTVAECLATRLCHDVAGLIATVSGTLEMALDDMETESEAATLAQEAAGQLAARVRLYRAAWGGGDMEGDGVTGLAEGLPNRARLNLALDPALSDGRLPRDGGRVLLCVLLAATAGMPRGGDITAAAWPARIAVNASELEQSLHDADARGLAAPMAALVAAATRWRLSVDGLRLTASG